MRPVRLVALGDRRDGDRRGPALRRPRRPAADLAAARSRPRPGSRSASPSRCSRASSTGRRSPARRPAASAILELEAVSTVRLLTIPAGRKKSDAAQQLRDPATASAATSRSPAPSTCRGARRTAATAPDPRHLSRPLEGPSCHAASPGLARPPRRAHRGASDPALRLRRARLRHLRGGRGRRL